MSGEIATDALSDFFDRVDVHNMVTGGFAGPGFAGQWVVTNSRDARTLLPAG